MRDFKPGDEVVCVRASDPEYPHAIGVVEGQIYTVDAVAPTRWSDGRADGTFVVFLVEAGWKPKKLPRGGYTPSWFRKVQRKSSALSIERFLTITPGFEEPKRTPVITPERETAS